MTKGNGSTGPAVSALGEEQRGPPTLPLDQVVHMMKELEDAHRILDALNAPPGTLSERLVARARDWLARTGQASQSRPATEARTVIKAAGAPMWVPPGLIRRGQQDVEGGKTGE